MLQKTKKCIAIVSVVFMALSACSGGQSSKLSDSSVESILNRFVAEHEKATYFDPMPMPSFGGDEIEFSERGRISEIGVIHVEGNSASVPFTVMYVGESSGGTGKVERAEGSSSFVRTQDGDWVLTKVLLNSRLITLNWAVP